MEGRWVLPGLGKHLLRHLFDAGGVLWRQVHQQAQVAGAPLQPGGRAHAAPPSFGGPAQRVRIAALLAGVAGQLAHQVVGGVAFGQVGLQQRVTVSPQPGLGQQPGAVGQHGLALMTVADLPVITRHLVAHLLHQHGRQLGPQCVLGQVNAGQRHARIQCAQAVRARQADIGLQPLQRSVQRLHQRTPLGTGLGRQGFGDAGGVVDQHVHLRPHLLRVGQQVLHTRPQRGVGLDALAVITLGQGLEQQPGGGRWLSGRARRRQLRQQAGPIGGCHQLRLIDVPAVKRQQPPFRPAHRPAGTRIGQHRRHAAAAGQALLQQRQHLGCVHLTGQAGDLAAVGPHQDHGGVAAHLEPAPQFLRARHITVDVHRHQRLGLLDEILPVEQGGLELVARWAPGRTPVQQQWFFVAAGPGERPLDIGVAASLQPGHLRAADAAACGVGCGCRTGQHGGGQCQRCSGARQAGESAARGGG